jgi:hypothetical protein
LATPNYAFAKRQRDLNKQRKKEEKLKRKAGPAETPPAADDQTPAKPETPGT